MDKKVSKSSVSSVKRGFGAFLIVFSAIVFMLACIPNFLNIGNFFLGVFGIMVYPLCVLLCLVGIALMLGLRYTFNVKFTIYICISVVSLLCLFHALFTAKVMLNDYTSFSKMGAYLKACYLQSSGVTVGGLLMGILVFLIRGILGVGGTYVFYAVIATIFVGLVIDYIIYSRNRKQKKAKAKLYEPAVDEKSGLSPEEYSFNSETQTQTFPAFDFKEEEQTVGQENLFKDNSINYSFNDFDNEQKTQNDDENYAKSVLFGSFDEKKEEKEEESEPKSARDILFGDGPKVPNIFDRSSEDRDAWKKQYASKPLVFSDDETKNEKEETTSFDATEKSDDGTIKTSWGEYRPTSSFSQSSSIDRVAFSDRNVDRNNDRNIDRNLDRRNRNVDASANSLGESTLERNRIFDRNERTLGEQNEERARDLSRNRDGLRDRVGRLGEGETQPERMTQGRQIRERTSVSNFSRENDQYDENTEFSSRLSERRGSDILANASALGIEMKDKNEEESSFTQILDRQRNVSNTQNAQKERNIQRENLSRHLNQNQKYTPPPTNILTIYKEDNADYSEEYKQKSAILESTLSAFKIPAKVINVVRGPKVTRYELSMPTGIPVTKILSYERDMSMNLASKSGVRIEAPIPGKNAFGVEVENAKSSTVGFRELVESPEFINFKGPLAVAVGKNISGEVIIKSLASMVHLLVASSTGSGKSVFLHSLIMSLMYKYSPDELRFIMIDPKRVEFTRYNGMPHLMLPEIVNECSKAVNSLNWAVKEMERRYDLLMKNRCQKLEQFNECAAVKNGEEKKLPYLVIVVDELAELMSVAKKEVEGKIQRITQLGRAAGIHMVIATQRPSVDVVTGVIKNNLPTRVALSLSSAIDSMTVINQGGAEKLLGHGDMLLSVQGGQLVRLQGAFVSDEEIEKTLDFIKAHNESVYDEEVQKEIYAEPEKQESSDDDSSAGSSDDRMDELMPQALKLVMKNGKASISMVQRRFSVGYARAARIIDQMETHGFIDGGIGNKPRDVKITIEEYNELFGNFDGE